MARETILAARNRRGETVLVYPMPVDQTMLSIWVLPNPAVLVGDAIGLSCVIEQSPNAGITWFPIGGFNVPDLRVPLTAPGKFTGIPPTELRWRFSEQVYRDDILAGRNWTTRRTVEDGSRYYQMALCPEVRITFRSYDPNTGTDAFLNFSADLEAVDALPTVRPSASNSMALIGNFTAAEGNGALTTSSRTSISGSLVTIHGANWNSSAGGNVTLTSNQAGTYTELQDFEISPGAGNFVNIGMSYNIGGTRAAGHTCSCGATAGANTLSASEWSGIDPTPNVGSNTGTSTGTAISDSITVGESAGIIMLITYAGSSTTIATNGGSQASETDENSDFQAQAVHYKVAQTGTPSIAATLGASSLWGVIIASFEEEAGAAAVLPPRSTIVSQAVHRAASW